MADAQDPQAGAAAPGEQVRRAVRRSVVDDDDFVVPLRLRLEAVEGPCESGAAVAGGQEEGDEGRRHAMTLDSGEW